MRPDPEIQTQKHKELFHSCITFTLTRKKKMCPGPFITPACVCECVQGKNVRTWIEEVWQAVGENGKIIAFF